MNNVLLPTDLTVLSLRPVHDIVKHARGQQITIHVVHLISMPTSIGDLLFIKEKKPFHAIPQKFIDAFQLLQNKYRGVVKGIVFDFLFCNSSRYLNNYIDANQIDAVYMLKDYDYTRPLKQSEDFVPCLKKCRVPVQKLELGVNAYADYENFSALLNGPEQLISPLANRKEKIPQL